MSNDADLEYGPTPEGAAYEHTDIDPAVGYRFALWLAVAMVLSAGLVYGTFAFLERGHATRDQAPVFPLAAGQSQEPPAPRLQTQPFTDVFQLKGEQRAALHAYGWLDKANGVVHIPIDRAMDLMLERGVPARTDAPATLSPVVPDLSAGRTATPR